MASLLQAASLVLFLLLISKGFATITEDRELQDLLDELEAGSITKRENPIQRDDRDLSAKEPETLSTETNMQSFENMIDNVDHMKENLKLSGLGDIQDTITTEEDYIPIDTLYEPVGCFSDPGGNKRPLPILLKNLRSEIDWHNLNRTIRACARLAQAKGFRYFGIQFYGECWSGPAGDQTFDKEGSSRRCVAGVGKTWANFVYRFKEEECVNYIELNTADRSKSHGATGVYTCDKSLTKGWYRFTGQAGTHMATKCVPKKHCGAHAPGWMTGTLPSVAEGIVARKVCFNWRDNCCHWDSEVLVKNCGKFFVYRLEKPPHCRLRYCGSPNNGNKRTITSDIPDTSTDSFLEPGEGMEDVLSYHEVISGEKKEPIPNSGTEMDMYLGNDEVIAEYQPVGCYHDRRGQTRPLPILLENLRPKIDWKNLNKTIRECASLAQDRNYQYFGIQFYGECWSGPSAEQTYDVDGSSKDCVLGVGKGGSNFVYRFLQEEKTTTSPITTAPPSQDKCSNYTELDSPDRSETYPPGSEYTCDKSLTKGWYRFTGQAGTHMATECVPKFHCGAHAPGWMTGTLPSVAEGIVTRKVCFNWRDNCCHWNSEVLVKNCGEFYLYSFQPTPLCRLRYCGSDRALPTAEPPTTVESTTTQLTTTSRPSTPRPTTIDECTNYDQLDSADRSENHGPNGDFYCDKTLSQGWYRFSGQAGTHMSTKCPTILHCGTHAPGWMNGTLPSVAEGIVSRTVCFNWLDDCCRYTTSVLLRNCGGFFVYNLRKPPLCKLRYCGSDEALPTVTPATTSRPPTSKPATVKPTTKRPIPIRTFRICEHRSGILRCPPGQKIKIRYANYGRTQGRKVCRHPSIRTTKCYSSVAANLIRCACNGRNSCPLFAKNQVYGDPCVGTFKYIEVKYQCLHQIMSDTLIS